MGLQRFTEVSQGCCFKEGLRQGIHLWYYGANIIAALTVGSDSLAAVLLAVQVYKVQLVGKGQVKKRFLYLRAVIVKLVNYRGIVLCAGNSGCNSSNRIL